MVARNDKPNDMKKTFIEQHSCDGVVLVDKRTGLFLKAFWHADDDELRGIFCSTPNQAHVFCNAPYLDEFLELSRRSPYLRRRNWLRVQVSRETTLSGSIDQIYNDYDI